MNAACACVFGFNLCVQRDSATQDPFQPTEQHTATIIQSDLLGSDGAAFAVVTVSGF